MKFGIFDHLDLGMMPASQLFKDRLSLLETYDRLGFYAYHLAEHHGTTLGVASSPSVFLAAAIQRTQRLRLGPLNFSVSLYHPLRLLEEICMLDHMSEGRLELGVGRGVSPFEVGYFGIDPTKTPAIFREVLEILRKGFASSALSHEGEFFQFRDVPMILKPLQQPHPPIWYGISSPNSAEWAAKSGLNVVSISRVPIVREISDKYRSVWRENGGVSDEMPCVGLSRHVVVAPTDGAALDIARPAYRVWRESFVRLYKLHGTMPTVLPFPEEFDDAQKAGYTVAGSPATVRDWLKDQITGAGVTYFAAQLAFGTMTLDSTRGSVNLFVQEVMPALRELG